ncbi:MAG: RAD55 family ATPase [Candidatus Hydrothermarchaeota archaeon]
MKRMKTGIDELDKMLEGGYPVPSIVLILGDSGSGKSIFAQQFLWKGIKEGENNLYISIDHSPSEIRESMSKFGWNYNKKDLNILDCYSERLGFAHGGNKYVENPYNLNNLYRVISESIENSENQRNTRLVLDSASTLIMRTDFNTIYRFFQKFAGYLMSKDAVGLITLHKGMHNSYIENSMRQICNGVLHLMREWEEYAMTLSLLLKKTWKSRQIRRYIWIDRMHATKHTTEVYSFSIDDHGIKIIR